MLTDVSDANKEYKKIGNNEETKASLRNDLVPLKLFDILYNDMYLKNNEMIVWMTLRMINYSFLSTDSVTYVNC